MNKQLTDAKTMQTLERLATEPMGSLSEKERSPIRDVNVYVGASQNLVSRLIKRQSATALSKDRSHTIPEL